MSFVRYVFSYGGFFICVFRYFCISLVLSLFHVFVFYVLILLVRYRCISHVFSYFGSFPFLYVFMYAFMSCGLYLCSCSLVR